MSYFAKVETTVTIASDSGYTDNYERRVLDAYVVAPTEHMSQRVIAPSGVYVTVGILLLGIALKFLVLKNWSASFPAIVKCIVLSTGVAVELDLPAGGIMVLPCIKTSGDLQVKGVLGVADIEVIACS